jgi:hypothetical protein
LNPIDSYVSCSVSPSRPERYEVRRGWRKLHNEELHNFYSSRSIIRLVKLWRMRLVGHVAEMGREMYIGYWRESQTETTTGNQVVNGWIILRLDIGEVGWDYMDWIYLAQDRDRWTILVNLRVPHNAGGHSGRAHYHLVI